MARRTLNRKDLRADFEAAEQRKQRAEGTEDAETEDDEDGDDDEDEVETDEAEATDEDGEEEEAPPKRKAPAKAPKAKSRTRTPKVTRMKVVWGVFNNSNQRVAVFEYAQRREAEEMAARLRADKKTTHFIQPVKEPLDEKPEAQ